MTRRETYDPYLWDGSGEPDPDVVRSRGVARPPAPPGRAAAAAQPQATRPAAPVCRPWRRSPPACLLAVAAVWFAVCREPLVVGCRAACRHARGRRQGDLRHAPVCGRRAARDGRASRAPGSPSATSGRWTSIRTRACSSSRRAAASTACRSSAARSTRESGRRRSSSSSTPRPPRRIDLGCAYTLQVDDDGAGLLRVTHGWVGFERDGREAFIPQGAMCATRRGRGARHATIRGCAVRLRRGAHAARLRPSRRPGTRRGADLVLSQARRRDALTLWHLLARGTADERAQVYDRLAVAGAAAAGRDARARARGDATALNMWWDSLGFETGTWWRLLKKKW